MALHRHWIAACAGLFWAALASAQPAGELELQSCVAGSPPLRVPATAARAVLDAADSQRLHDAALARYPMYQRGGLVPVRVLMIRRGVHWQYVTMWRAGASGSCFSAVFAADRFDFTAAWLAKYKPRAGEADD